MKQISLGVSLLALMAATLSASPLSIGFSSVSGASLNFDGSGHFQFLNNIQGTDCDPSTSSSCTGRDFAIGAVSGSPALSGLTGLQGNISGLFSIGAVTNVPPSTQTAPTTGTGVFSINDGNGNAASDFFTATLQWIGLGTITSGGSTTGFGKVLLSNYSYAGTDTALQALAASPFPSAMITLQAALPGSVSTLKTTSESLSYSGTLAPTAIPEPGLYVFLSAGLVGLLWAVRRRYLA
jgi:hypothetical protein